MTIESSISFFIAIFIFGITPGPGIFAILAKAMVQGGRSCFMLSLGMTLSDICYLILACMGLATIAEHWGEVFTVIRWVGAGYLLYLGYKLFTSPVSDADTAEIRSDRSGDFLQGFLISASNPKVILFYIAFLPTFMDLQSLQTTDIALASLLTLFALMAGLILVAHSAHWASAKLKSRHAQQYLNRSAGSIMMGAGVYLIASR